MLVVQRVALKKRGKKRKIRKTEEQLQQRHLPSHLVMAPSPLLHHMVDALESGICRGIHGHKTSKLKKRSGKEVREEKKPPCHVIGKKEMKD